MDIIRSWKPNYDLFREVFHKINEAGARKVGFIVDQSCVVIERPNHAEVLGSEIVGHQDINCFPLYNLGSQLPYNHEESELLIPMCRYVEFSIYKHAKLEKYNLVLCAIIRCGLVEQS